MFWVLCNQPGRWSGGEGEGGIARETFVNSLAKFTLLDTVKEMRPKNIDCVKALLDIVLEDGNFLAESWGSVLRYISQLARLQVGDPNMTSTFCLHYRWFVHKLALRVWRWLSSNTHAHVLLTAGGS